MYSADLASWCMLTYTVSAGKCSPKLKSEFPLHTHAEHCRTMTKHLSWYMKSTVEELVMSFFKAAEVVKALQCAEFGSVLEMTRWIRRGFVDLNASLLTEKSYFLSILGLTLIHSLWLSLSEAKERFTFSVSAGMMKIFSSYADLKQRYPQFIINTKKILYFKFRFL